MAEPDVQRYLDGVGSHNQKPRFMSTLEAVLEKIDGVTMVMKDMPRCFSVSDAVGKQLDVLGQIVGTDRRFPSVPVPGYPEMLTDDLYRYVVLAKIVQNQWNGTTEAFREIWENTLGKTIDAEYHDNQDMSMDVNMIGNFDPLMVELILANYIIPKPMGVRMNVGVISRTEESSLAGAVATADILRAAAGIDYFPDRDTANSTGAGAACVADVLRAAAGIDYFPDRNTEVSAHAGADCVSDILRASVPIHRRNDQPDQPTVRSGATATANSARITITTTI